MRYARYLRMEKYIAASDSGGVLERWRMGRRLLQDDTAMSASRKSLRPGIAERLIINATAMGYKTLSTREIQYRLQAARAYETEAQICKILADLDNWWGLIKAGFPAVEAESDEEAFDPRDADEKARDAARELARRSGQIGEQDQLTLFDYFPDDRFDETSTLAELSKYAAEMAELTERYARKDRGRAEYLASLIAAVNGDMGATWEEAQAALDGTA